MSDLKEMCDVLKKEKAEAERKLGNVRGVSTPTRNTGVSSQATSGSQQLHSMNR